MDVEEILAAIQRLPPAERTKLIAALRPSHPLETLWNTSSDIILEAIHRSGDLTQRGVRGIITELEFQNRVISKLRGWKAAEIFGDTPVDFSLSDGVGSVTVQVKMQRKAKGEPVTAQAQRRSWPADKYIVEVQKTRGGKKKGKLTRPYSFGDFDILAVSLHPSTGDWSKFVYTVGRWLTPRPSAKKLIEVFQVVSPVPDEFWTDNFLQAVEWFRSKQKKKIRYANG